MRQPTTKLIQRWIDQGPVTLEKLEDWRREDGWGEDWLAHCEEAMASDAEDLLNLLSKQLSKVEMEILDLTKSRLNGDSTSVLMQKIENSLNLAKDPENRELTLEGRLRMERGLIHVENGDLESARDDLTWAETRLRSVAKASRDHDLALLNKAAFHILADENLMALQAYSEIPRQGEHSPDTVAFSRYGAAQIHAHMGQFSASLRHAWTAHKLALESSLSDLAWVSGTTFLAVGAESIDDEAPSMDEQVKSAKPRDLDAQLPPAQVNTEDYRTVFTACIELWDGEVGGESRQDLMGLLSAALNLQDTDSIAELFIIDAEQFEDAFLVAALLHISTPEESKKWQKRLTDMMILAEPD